MITTWVVALVVCGLIFLVLEVLIFPGFGVSGVLGIAGLCGGCILAYAQMGPKAGLLTCGISIASALALMFFLPRTRAGQAMILKTSQEDASPFADTKPEVGAQGVAEGHLRPSGSARFEGRLVDVVSDGEFVERGSSVIVVQLEGTRVVVREHSNEQPKE